MRSLLAAVLRAVADWLEAVDEEFEPSEVPDPVEVPASRLLDVDGLWRAQAADHAMYSEDSWFEEDPEGWRGVRRGAGGLYL